MSENSDVKSLLTQYFAETADAKNRITAEQLADFVQRDGKTVRARLRKQKVRNQSEYKGARWRLTFAQALSEAEHYARLDSKSE